MSPATPRPSPRRPPPQAGLTLVELLVALAVGLAVTLAALSMLVLGRTGFNAVDHSAQLIDKERFAVDIIGRVVAQAGFEDYAGPVLSTREIAAMRSVDAEPDLFAWNDAMYTNTPTLPALSEATQLVDGSRSSCAITDTSCRNGSDVLLVRFHGVNGTSTTSDMSMIDCRGNGVPALAGGNLDGRAIAFFHIQRDATTGEPSLHCATYDHATASYSNQAILEGVEAMQVLFGTDNVVPATPPATTGADTVADRWLRADQLKVLPLNPAATRENFRRIRAVRIGLVLRGPVGSAQERVTARLFPLGTPTFAVSGDAGSILNVAADGRLRRVITFTVHIRNELGLR